MHVHLRDGEMFKKVHRFTTDKCAGGVVMGNLTPPLVTAGDVRCYRHMINRSAPEFNAIVAPMLTKSTTLDVVKELMADGTIVLKWIPGNTSTNSSTGVPLTEWEMYSEIFDFLQTNKIVLSWHLELTHSTADNKVLDEVEREAAAIPFLLALHKAFPRLKIVVEHASTAKMIQTVETLPDHVAATLTPHHAILTTADVLSDKKQVKLPFNYCKPIAKSESDRQAVVQAMMSGNPKFFFGSDSAPHPASRKVGENVAAGIFSAPFALELIFQLFFRDGYHLFFQAFASEFGPRFYGIKPSEEFIELYVPNTIFPVIMI